MKIKLSPDEKTLYDAIEAGEWVEVDEMNQSKNTYRRYAEAALKKNRRINIRLSERDLEGFQKRALEDGLPYQTLIASVLHKYIKGKLIETE